MDSLLKRRKTCLNCVFYLCVKCSLENATKVQRTIFDTNFRSLSELSTQKVSYVSFLEIDTLHLYLSNLDPGVKTIVTEDIQNLKVSGRLDQTSASMRFFLRNTRVNNGDIIFDDFYATTPVSLMNIQVRTRTLPCYVNDKCTSYVQLVDFAKSNQSS